MAARKERRRAAPTETSWAVRKDTLTAEQWAGCWDLHWVGCSGPPTAVTWETTKVVLTEWRTAAMKDPPWVALKDGSTADMLVAGWAAMLVHS